MRVGTSLPRFSVEYTLSLEVLDPAAAAAAGAAAAAAAEPLDKVLRLTDYFEEGGAFHEDWFVSDVKEVVADAIGKRKGQ